eukprot:gene6613-10776_t
MKTKFEEDVKGTKAQFFFWFCAFSEHTKINGYENNIYLEELIEWLEHIFQDHPKLSILFKNLEKSDENKNLEIFLSISQEIIFYVKKNHLEKDFNPGKKSFLNTLRIDSSNLQSVKSPFPFEKILPHTYGCLNDWIIKSRSQYFTEKNDTEYKTLVVKGHRFTDGIEGVQEYVMKLLPEYEMEDILKSNKHLKIMLIDFPMFAVPTDTSTKKVELWICNNGATKRRVREGIVNGSQVLNGYNARGFCSGTFNPGYTQTCMYASEDGRQYPNDPGPSFYQGRRYIYWNGAVQADTGLVFW